MSCAVDAQATALLLVLIEQNGGDIRAAFRVLCTRVTTEEVAGESFERALARAVGSYFSRPALALAGLRAPPLPAQGPANDG